MNAPAHFRMVSCAAAGAKTFMLERQLQEAHARCRRAEQVNAQWRSQHAALRKRERDSWERLQAALKKAERAEETLLHNQRLREALARRSAELVRAGQRCAELEVMVEQLREGLARAMRGLRPEVLDAL